MVEFDVKGKYGCPAFHWYCVITLIRRSVRLAAVLGRRSKTRTSVNRDGFILLCLMFIFDSRRNYVTLYPTQLWRNSCQRSSMTLTLQFHVLYRYKYIVNCFIQARDECCAMSRIFANAVHNLFSIYFRTCRLV